MDIRNPGNQAELANNLRAAQGRNIPQTERQPVPSSHIPVPRNRYRVALDIYASIGKKKSVLYFSNVIIVVVVVVICPNFYL